MTREEKADKFLAELSALADAAQAHGEVSRERATIAAMASYLSTLVADDKLPLFTDMAPVAEVDKKGMN